MPWTLEEIQNEWLQGEALQLSADDVTSAFNHAERIRGREWVLSTTHLPGGGRIFGFLPFIQVYSF
jgi:hypothetical protein